MNRTATHRNHALLVLPRLRVQNANAISSPLTHGFPSITAFTGLMWALQRRLAAADIPLKLLQVGVICHHHEEQVSDGYVKTFRLTRNPADRYGETVAIVEEGRIHLEVTVLFRVTESPVSGAASGLASGNDEMRDAWAERIGEIVARMRVAGGTILPARSMPGRRTRPSLAVLAESPEQQAADFAEWRRHWLPGYALVGRDDLLADRYRALRATQPDATLLDAWLHAARFNHEPVHDDASHDAPHSAAVGKQRWADPARRKGAGWTVPIPVGYAALTKPLPAGSVVNARDPSTPFVFVESVYSFGQWISPHRLNHLDELMWRAQTDPLKGLYRCRSGYAHDGSSVAWASDDLPDFD